ncbi:protein of unknown function [Methylocella tundrae]|uniref:Uncharacterized protein n=1 Tax=Methylocella tundrae TaxID=227605 RepID=A0A4U8YZR7_METTU|nr:protein of unknown function [Methylocella tundrae]
MQAIACSRRWMGAIHSGQTASFDAIAGAQHLAERISAALRRWLSSRPKSCRRSLTVCCRRPDGLSPSPGLLNAPAIQEQMLGLSWDEASKRSRRSPQARCDPTEAGRTCLGPSPRTSPNRTALRENRTGLGRP